MPPVRCANLGIDVYHSFSAILDFVNRCIFNKLSKIYRAVKGNIFQSAFNKKLSSKKFPFWY